MDNQTPNQYKIGSCVSLIEGGNQYLIREIHLTKQDNNFEGYYLLECVDFWCDEDLGDRIVCNRLGQKLWVAHGAIYRMKVQPI